MRTERSGGSTTGVLLWIVMAGVGFGPLQAGAVSLLDFPSNESVLAGDYKAWPLDEVASPALGLTFSIDPGLAAALAGGADVAARNAISTWDAANGTLTYLDAGYAPVENSRTNFMGMWIGGGEWEGGAADQGLGANVDIMARDQNFSITDYRGKLHGFKDSGQSGNGSLAFTVINAANSQILSVDLYLNAAYSWSTDGGDFDVETVLLHELGHAVGLDHPDQATAMGGENYDPWSFQPGNTSTGLEAMHSGYWPDGICRELSDDEQGGLAFLYPGLPGDFDASGVIDSADIDLLSDQIYHSDWFNPVFDLNGDGDFTMADMDILVFEKVYIGPGQSGTYYGDFNLDGFVDLDDFVVLKDNYLDVEFATWLQGDADGDGDTDADDFVLLAQSYGRGPRVNAAGSVPEPATVSLLALGSLALLRRRQ